MLGSKVGEINGSNILAFSAELAIKWIAFHASIIHLDHRLSKSLSFPGVILTMHMSAGRI